MTTLQRESKAVISQFTTEDGTNYCRQETQLPDNLLVAWFEVDGGVRIDLCGEDQEDLERLYQNTRYFEGWLEKPIYNEHYHVLDLITGVTWITQIRVSPDTIHGGYYKWFLDLEGVRVRLDLSPKRFLFRQIFVSPDEIRSLQDITPQP